MISRSEASDEELFPREALPGTACPCQHQEGTGGIEVSRKSLLLQLRFHWFCWMRHALGCGTGRKLFSYGPALDVSIHRDGDLIPKVCLGSAAVQRPPPSTPLLCSTPESFRGHEFSALTSVGAALLARAAGKVLLSLSSLSKV